MVERFNQTLNNLLGTLEDRQKRRLESFVAPLVHFYNSTRHDSTGHSPLFLMYGRHARLAVDAYFNIPSPVENNIKSKDHYVTKLKKRLDFAYKVASREAENSTGRSQANYDSKNSKRGHT